MFRSTFHSQKRQTDIQVLPENPEGQDYIIGDLHGCRVELELVLSKLGPHDRLFLVGNLFDYGPDSLGVYQTIQGVNAQRKKEGLPPKIYAVKGEHEEEFLNFHRDKTSYEAALDAYMENFNHLKELHQSGSLSSWSYNILLKELEAQYEQVFQHEQFFYSLTNRYTKELGGDWAYYLTLAQRKEMAAFVQSLPYIIHVKGTKPFNVVHADLPFTHEKLLGKLAHKSFGLSAEEQVYATKAGNHEGVEVPLQPKKEASSPPPSYCGHIYGGGARPESQHYNFNAQTHENQLMFLFCHQTQKLEVIANTVKVDQREVDRLLVVGQQIKGCLVEAREGNKLQSGAAAAASRPSPGPTPLKGV